MLEPMFDIPEPVLGLRARGRLERDDCRNMLEPHLDRVRSDGRGLRLLCEVSPDFHGLSKRAWLEELRIARKCLSALDRCALTMDWPVGRAVADRAARLTPFRARVFGLSERDEALRWLNAMPQQRGLSLRYRPELRVLIVQHVGPITTEDFEALEEVAEAFGEAERWPRGIVVQSRGPVHWDRPGTLLRHLQVVWVAAARVERIALSVDGSLASGLTRLADQLLGAEVAQFPNDALWEAATWAAGFDDSDSAPMPPPLRVLDPVDEAGVESFPASDPPAY